ncbi:MAG: TolC family protein [Anaeromyxobacter sp.]
MAAAEEAVVAAAARARVARANRLPSLTLTGTLALDALDPSKIFTGDAVATSIGAGILAPIFDGGRLSAFEDFARADIEATGEQWRNTVFGALREVADASWSHRTLARVRQAQEIEVASSKEAERLARLRFEGGVTNFLEVLDAQRQSFAAETALVQTERDEIVTIIQLYRALGGGWELPPEQPAGQPAQGAPAALPAASQP